MLVVVLLLVFGIPAIDTGHNGRAGWHTSTSLAADFCFGQCTTKIDKAPRPGQAPEQLSIKLGSALDRLGKDHLWPDKQPLSNFLRTPEAVASMQSRREQAVVRNSSAMSAVVVQTKESQSKYNSSNLSRSRQ